MDRTNRRLVPIAICVLGNLFVAIVIVALPRSALGLLGLPVAVFAAVVGIRDYGLSAVVRRSKVPMKGMFDRGGAIALAAIAISFILAYLPSLAHVGHKSYNPPGQAERIGNSYFADDHGSLIPISRSEYDARRAEEKVLFSNMGALFCTVTGLAMIFARARSSEHHDRRNPQARK